MSKYRVTLRPALDGKQPIQRNGVSLEARPEGTLLHLLALPSTTELRGFSEHAANLSLRPVSPGQWFAVGDTALPHADLQALASSLKAETDIVDQSHGRIRILVRGPMATRVLAKGTAVDLAIFPVGLSATTLIGHITTHVTRIDEDAFELIVLRGFAESLWDELVQMSLEFS
jgi:sarcosine oxidase subunit gamma